MVPQMCSLTLTCRAKWKLVVLLAPMRAACSQNRFDLAFTTGLACNLRIFGRQHAALPARQLRGGRSPRRSLQSPASEATYIY